MNIRRHLTSPQSPSGEDMSSIYVIHLHFIDTSPEGIEPLNPSERETQGVEDMYLLRHLYSGGGGG